LLKSLVRSFGLLIGGARPRLQLKQPLRFRDLLIDLLEEPLLELINDHAIPVTRLSGYCRRLEVKITNVNASHAPQGSG
jgi:hypothetical protein